MGMLRARWLHHHATTLQLIRRGVTSAVTTWTNQCGVTSAVTTWTNQSAKKVDVLLDCSGGGTFTEVAREILISLYL